MPYLIDPPGFFRPKAEWEEYYEMLKRLDPNDHSVKRAKKEAEEQMVRMSRPGWPVSKDA
jgi:hypothetical protein